MHAYYNEIDKYAANWLRNLIAAGHIAPGDVDERSIEDVHPSDLKPYTQCHFFAGIGVWSLALRRAGWSDDRPIWTGSCPCQPFSSAGAGAGFTDERHLWPAFYHLIEQRRPAAILGEQVASKDANPWIDLVQADLEALGYGVGAVAFPSAGIGAPHIRDRCYWLAHASGTGLEGRQPARQRALPQLTPIERSDKAGGLADMQRIGRQAIQRKVGANMDSGTDNKRAWPGPGPSRADGATRPGPTNGYWADADWLLCRDGRWRPVEPGTFPLVDGATNRLGRLRAYGNAINAKAAQVFIECVMECMP